MSPKCPLFRGFTVLTPTTQNVNLSKCSTHFLLFQLSPESTYIPIPISIFLLDSDKAAAIAGDVSLQTASGDIGGGCIQWLRDPVCLVIRMKIRGIGCSNVKLMLVEFELFTQFHAG